MELAADSISVKVSEAIMHMQENSVSISTKASKMAEADDGEIKETLMHLYCFPMALQTRYSSRMHCTFF